MKLSSHASKLFKDWKTGGLDQNRWEALDDEQKILQRLNYIAEGAIALGRLLPENESENYKTLVPVLMEEIVYLGSTAVEAGLALDEGAHIEATGLALTTGLQLGFVRMVLSDFDSFENISARRKWSKQGGKAAKRMPWADDLAQHLAEKKLRFAQAWSTISKDSNDPLILDEDVCVYRGEDDLRVFAFDDLAGVDLGSQSRTNFSKRYFYPACKYVDPSKS